MARKLAQGQAGSNAALADLGFAAAGFRGKALAIDLIHSLTSDFP
jgi:hypothetical protein